MRVLSVNVGQSREVLIKGRPVRTGFDKRPVSGPVAVGPLGLCGDVRIEPRKLGLEHHAVYAYAHEHYAHWQQVLGRPPFAMGHFGENLTVCGLLEEEVRIGDVLRFGSAVLQVAQPRIPCAKLNDRMGLRFSPMFLASRRVGYYLRVLAEGAVAAGDRIELLERDATSPTMEEFVRVSQYEYWDAEGLRGLLRARDLLPGWREIIEGKLERTLAAAGWHGLREFVITRRDDEGEDTVSLTLQCAKGRPLSAYAGGQYLTVVLGAHTAQQRRRNYALTGDPRDLASYRICVRRQPPAGEALAEGVMSSHLVSLPVGGRLMCAAPSGALTLPPADSGRTPLLVSEGMGLASIVGLLHALAARQAPRVDLFHQPSGPDPRVLMQEVEALVRRHPGFRLVRLAPGSEFLTARLLDRQVALAQAEVYLAGARAWVERLGSELAAAGLPAAALKTQAYS